LDKILFYEGERVRYLLQAMLLSATLIVTGCGSLDQPDNPKVEGGEMIVSTTAKQVLDGLLKAEARGITKDTVLFGYQAYLIPYKTTDEEGNTVDVSGLMAVPTDIPEEIAPQVEAAGFSVVSDDHGTIFANSEAPTVSNQLAGTPKGSALILTALNGFVTLQPDYIGHGDSADHYHPYMLKKSLANSTVDFIKAARVFAKNNNIKLNPLLFVTGYSEGGYAAMATLQKIENEGELQVAMAAPMAGPYALDYMALGVLSAPTIGVPSFMAEVGYAYSKAYGQDVSKVINEPYASKLPELFSGDYNRTQIDSELTHDTLGLFSPSFVADVFGPTKMGNPDNWFMQAVSINSVYKWAPQTPVALVQCESDDVIPYALSQKAFEVMTEMGAKQMQMVPVEKTIQALDPEFPSLVGHGACGAPAYTVTAGIFKRVREQVVGY
jgi:predicted esterase